MGFDKLKRHKSLNYFIVNIVYDLIFDLNKINLSI